MNNQLAYGGLGLLIGVLATWLVFVNTGNNFNWPAMMGSAPADRQMGNFTQIDAHFIEQMIPHHEDAITMSNLALEKAKRPEIKQLAQSIISSQSAEIEQMKDWYRDWFGRDVASGNEVMMHHGMMSGAGFHMGMMGDASDTDRLANAADFDKAFIEEMIPHHQMAVMMASMLKQGTERAEMQQLADNITEAQTSEINQMRQWHNAWY